MKENEIKDELSSIRSMMERSSKFISLSGLSGVLAGVYAILGAGLFYYLAEGLAPIESVPQLERLANRIPILIAIPVVVLLAAVLTAYFLAAKKARKKNLSVWNATSRILLYNMLVPLLTGGLLMVILFFKDGIEYVSAVSLIFYGIAMFVAGNFTFKDVRYLGISDILLGLLAAIMPGYGLLFWVIGFGLLHIIYGSIMYIKYDR